MSRTPRSPRSPRRSAAARLAGLLAAATLPALAACQTPPQRYGETGGRVEVTRDAPSEFGSRSPRSTDLVNATDRMAQAIAGRPDIVDPANPPTIVLGNVANRTTSIGPGDLDVYLVRLRATLNQSLEGRGIRFVRERAFVQDARASEYGNEPGSAPQDYRSIADYLLTAEIFDMPRGGTNYYLISFQLVQLREAAGGPDTGAGVIVWEGSYEVKFQ